MCYRRATPDPLVRLSPFSLSLFQRCEGVIEGLSPTPSQLTTNEGVIEGLRPTPSFAFRLFFLFPRGTTAPLILAQLAYGGDALVSVVRGRGSFLSPAGTPVRWGAYTTDSQSVALLRSWAGIPHNRDPTSVASGTMPPGWS